MRLRSGLLAVTTCTCTALSLFSASAFAGNQPVVGFGSTLYSVGSASLDAVAGGPWTTSQADLADNQTQQPEADLLPTYTPTLDNTTTQLSNLAAYPAATAGTGVGLSGQPGTPGPVDGYCSSGGAAPESGPPVPQPNISLPMSPYYFPFVVRNSDGTLTGYFDYRPKDTNEALVTASSSDDGTTWTDNGMALSQNGSYCPSGDTNDNGQGHAFVKTVGGTTYLYTLNRVAGDTVGVGLLVHTLTGDESNPLALLPAVQSVGVDPDSAATASTPLAATGGAGAAIPVASLGTAGTPTQLFTGTNSQQFLDATTLTPGSPNVITCTGAGALSLTGCTAARAETVNDTDLVEQVVATVENNAASPTPVSIPATHDPSKGVNASETGGVSVTITALPATIASLEESNLGGGRVYIDGYPVYCVSDTVNADNSITLQNCTSPTAFTADNGDPVTLDPIQPSGTQMTSGLVAPDGIVGTIPSYPSDGTGTPPQGAIYLLYGEKILNYYAPTATTAKVTLPASSSTTTVPVLSTAFLSSPLYSQLNASGGTFGGAGTLTLSFGDNTSGGFASLTCTGYTATSFTGCSTTSGASGDTISNGSEVAIPGAALVPSNVLALTGEGNSKSKSLYKNNEDYTVLRVAWTTDGIDFSDQYLANGGLISGPDPANDINNPAATTSPSTTAPYNNTVGQPVPTQLRFVGTRGTIVQNADGSETMIDSAAWATDGDSDAFNQIFVSTSTDGEHWSTPVTLVSTDYTFSARVDQDSALAAGTDVPLDVSAYYAGRSYSPAAVPNPDGSITLVFSGYSTPKPLPAVGSELGTGPTQWTVNPADPALYRDILTLTLTPQPSTQTPEAPLAAALPVLGIGILASGMAVTSRRRRRSRGSVRAA